MLNNIYYSQLGDRIMGHLIMATEIRKDSDGELFYFARTYDGLTHPIAKSCYERMNADCIKAGGTVTPFKPGE